MKKRLESKTRSHRASGATGSDATGVRPTGEITTGWKTRRVPLRKFSEKVLAKKKSTRPVDDLAQPTATPKSKSQIGEFQRVLVPIDFSKESTRALKFAAALAKRHQSNVTLVHVLGAAHDLRDFSYAKRRLSTLARKHLQTDLEWQPAVRNGNGPKQILQEAKEMEADVIVMSTRGLSNQPSSQIGSIAKQIVRQSPCPVLILPGRKDVIIKRAGK
jgi:nucleotide-binding universal stress UspA family protein